MILFALRHCTGTSSQATFLRKTLELLCWEIWEFLPSWGTCALTQGRLSVSTEYIIGRWRKI